MGIKPQLSVPKTDTLPLSYEGANLLTHPFSKNSFLLFSFLMTKHRQLLTTHRIRWETKTHKDTHTQKG